MVEQESEHHDGIVPPEASLDQLSVEETTEAQWDTVKYIHCSLYIYNINKIETTHFCLQLKYPFYTIPLQ